MFQVNLVEWLKTMVSSRNSEGVLDPKMTEKPTSRALKKALLVALRCVDPEARKRPKIGHVIHMLEVDDFPYRDVSQYGTTIFYLYLITIISRIMLQYICHPCLFFLLPGKEGCQDEHLEHHTLFYFRLLDHTFSLLPIAEGAPFWSLQVTWRVDTSFLCYKKYGFQPLLSCLNLLRLKMCVNEASHLPFNI